jgi:hypothetical protein
MAKKCKGCGSTQSLEYRQGGTYLGPQGERRKPGIWVCIACAAEAIRLSEKSKRDEARRLIAMARDLGVAVPPELLAEAGGKEPV